jgi:mannose-6-phosphate isomerase-like protein (cupin superfamily)
LKLKTGTYSFENMKSLLFIFLFLGVFEIAFAQKFTWTEEENKVYHLHNFEPGEFENIKVEKICTQEEATSFLIWVNDTVKPHYHQKHNETLYFIEGEGIFYVGGKKHVINPGDYITIPKNVVHAFKTTSEKPIKAISIQAPEFFGKDRLWVE